MASARGPRRGLVLGGGGMLGGAWAVGALAALEQVHGFDPRTCDVIVGTSAGSVLATLLGAGVTADAVAGPPAGHARHARARSPGYSWDYERAAGGARPQRPSAAGAGLGAPDRRQRPPAAAACRRPRCCPPSCPAGKGSLERVGHLVDAITPMGEWSPHPNLWLVAMDYETGAGSRSATPAPPPCRCHWQ